MVFPEYRPRRMRKNAAFRALIRENRLDPAQFVYPLFVMPGKKRREAIGSTFSASPMGTCAVKTLVSVAIVALSISVIKI